MSIGRRPRSLWAKSKKRSKQAHVYFKYMSVFYDHSDELFFQIFMTDRTSHRKKKRGASGNVSGNAPGMKKLRQKTLLGFTASEASPSLTRPHISSTVSPKKLNSPRKTKRRHVSDSSGLSDVTTIRLEPAAPTPKPEEGGDRSESPMPSHAKRRRMFVVESGSDEEETQSSSSEVVSVPRRRRLRRHVLAASESSEESSHSVDERKHQELVSEDDLSNEVDKHCTSPIALLGSYNYTPN